MKVSAALFAALFLFGGAAAAETVSAEQNAVSTEPMNVTIENGEVVLLSSDAVSESRTANREAMPNVFKAVLNTLAKNNAAKRSELWSKTADMLSSGDARGAAELLGAETASEFGASMAKLGRLCSKVIFRSEVTKEQTEFLRSFLKGYGKFGVFVISDSGVEKFTASGKTLGDMWTSVDSEASTVAGSARIYKGKNASFIPFSEGEIFKVDMLGKKNGTASVWKILPAGINNKTWEGGHWERELTVRGDIIY